MRSAIIAGIVAGVVLNVATVGAVLATPSPNGPGQPGAPGTTCGSPNAMVPPGSSALNNGSPFNSNGVAGMNYAGNPGTASLANANSAQAVSQYDIACFQVSSH
jgi:hypothetical protein